MTLRATDRDIREYVPDVPSATKLNRYLRTASVLTDKVSAADTAGELTSGQLREIEIFLACYYYTFFDPQYSSKSTGGASGSMTPADYWKAAADMDTTGYLKKVGAERKPTASASWLGRYPANQTDYSERNR